MKSIVGGKKLHGHMIKTGFPTDTFMENTLANMYAKCGFMDYARQVFDRMYERNVVSWTTMIAGYAQNWRGEEALEFYKMMLGEQLKPNQFTFASVLRACANLASAEHGKQIHAHVIKLGFASNVTMGNALVTMYSKSGNVENAINVFDGMSERDVVSWSALIAGCAQNGHGAEAQNLFSQMQWEGIESDKYTFSAVLVCCTGLEGLELGKQVHSYIIKMDFESDALLESTLMTMYAKCDAMESARKLFNQMLELDVVTWTAMIAGYARSGHGEESLILFSQMLRSGPDPDSFSLTSVLGVCADLAIVNQGRQFHAQAIKRGLELDISVGSALITMYAKCSCIEDAHEVFDKMVMPDVIPWTAMIAGYALHGLGKEAIQLFEQMQSAGIKPDHITFVGVLSACSHVGLVDEGRKYFDCMSRNYGITPCMEHYACIVDQLGRAGHLDEAERIINEMPFEPSAFVWGIFLSACRTHGNIKLGKRAAEQLLELEPKESAPYVLLSNIYAMENRWDDVSKVRKMMKDRGVAKEPGQSWIVVKEKVHAFYVEDTSHPQTEEIYTKLEELSGQIADAGYVQDTKFVLQNLEEDQKEHNLSHHSEKLAIAYGLISTKPGIPVRVFKNLRVCGDCHNATKFISLVTKREIVLRDANRFHHFKDGVCSCGDYW
ncbi:pentatricopeptide repeat-containing protein At1g11290, chloroplastic isoform X2 [Cryptomeria japonica]|nr:pentatricopeptide repeat-containing protein At1g11290, chloroplastic isoform X2 [Cryptomeria japonica]